MRNVLFIFFVLLAGKLAAQPLNNEWIDYTKTYYKFSVGKTGLYRIAQNGLPQIIQNTPTQNFQLWRNGKQVVLYTSIASGVFGSNDYIEFWGEQNDGKADKYLYRDPSFQINDRISLQTDTAAYFLTVNIATTSNPNLRYVNDATTNTLSPEPYFMHTLRYDFRETINRGFAYNAGENVYSSSYDIGEFFSTRDIQLGSPYSTTAANFYTFANGPVANLSAGFASNSDTTVRIQLGINNGLPLIDQQLTGLTAGVFSNNNVPISLLTNPSNSFTIKLNATNSFHRIVCNYIELKYPRIFDFGGASNFPFTLSPSLQGFNLNITNFTTGNSVPVLYDITNNKRYTTDISTPGIVKVALPPSAEARNLVLVSENAGNITSITGLQTRNFINYKLSANQGDYLIVSNKILGINPGEAVDAYRNYRTTQGGGSYNAKIYDIDELTDQFAYGIKKHPVSIKNFVRFAKVNFTATPPKLIFLIGKGTTYESYRYNENSVFADRLNLVPSWGWPASDNLLVSADLDPIPSLGVGRLSAISTKEVSDYFEKVKEYESKLTTGNQSITDKAWMKEMIHVVGADEPGLNSQLTGFLMTYENLVKDPLPGAHVTTFNKTSSAAISGTASADLFRIVNNGISMLSYFGHSAASALSYNLNEPSDYSNAGKYYMFFANGCSAGNFFDYDPQRLQIITSIAEKFVSAPSRGSIGFIGSTHFGITTQLNTYATAFYQSFKGSGYNKPVATNMLEGSLALKNSGFSDFFNRTHAEQSILNGDPAIKIYAFDKPDFVVEDARVIISPAILSVNDNNFNLKAYFNNIGRATSNQNDSVRVTVKRQYPDQSIATIYDQKIKSILFVDSVMLTVPIIASRDKGANKLIITIDPDNIYDELSELNNTVTKSFVIFDDILTPVYPYNYAIINKPSAKLIASTANPLSTLRNYVMEIDTTELYNSSFKITKNVSAVGGIVEFDPGIIFKDSTIYYWRVAQVPGNGVYNYSKSSFVYLANASLGFNQSHFYQHTHSSFDKMNIDSLSRRFNFNRTTNKITVKNSVYTGDDDEIKYSVAFNDDINPSIKGIANRPNNLTFNVFDSVLLRPMFNLNVGDANGKYGSLGYPFGNPGREYDFAFPIDNTASRNVALSFLDNVVPIGSYVVVRSVNLQTIYPNYTFAADWKLDGANSLYTRLKNAGFTDIDSFSRPRCFIFIYQKGISGFTPVSKFSLGSLDQLTVNTNLITTETQGTILSPKFGIAQKWKDLVWNGTRTDVNDIVKLQLIGINQTTNKTDTLLTLTDAQQQVNISNINAVTYPYLQLYLTVKDSVKVTPYQLRYWRLLYDPVPEGAIAPNIKYTFKDSLQTGESLNVSLAFKNVSDMVFRDSIVVKMSVLDKNNVTTTLPPTKLKKIAAGDTALVIATINTLNFNGNNTLLVDINPDNNQPEQYHFNNFVYRNFYVAGDGIKPVLDVTFDGLHILNNDIVSAKPNIRIKLKDESKFLALDDTSLVTLQLRFPDNSLHRYKFNTDTVRFTPANLASGENAATVDFTPFLLQDGVYELTVTGKDKSSNASGTQQYSVSFTVYNKALISNVFNYPNPFTSSTAFAFTLTGSEVPQNIKIQVLTVTGKVVREITRDELGPVHIGNNITQFKWDGRDMYGSELGNGVYLYRVVTNLNGNSLDKFNIPSSGGGRVDTDKYFKAGYGKMYLMR